jgi:hypothetical protein
MVVKTLEAALAIVIILSSVVFLFPGSSSQQATYSAYNCLRQMDQDGSLRYYASEMLTSGIESSLRGCIPVSFDYSVKLCQSSDCSTATPPGKSVFLTSYMISGADQFGPALVNVWVWSK